MKIFKYLLNQLDIFTLDIPIKLNNKTKITTPITKLFSLFFFIIGTLLVIFFVLTFVNTNHPKINKSLLELTDTNS